MGLTAFSVFIVPWLLLAVWLYSLPSAIRLGTPSTPWRPLALGRAQLEDQQRREAIRERQLHPNKNSDMASEAGSASTNATTNESHVMPNGGALGSMPEETEPKE